MHGFVRLLAVFLASGFLTLSVIVEAGFSSNRAGTVRFAPSGVDTDGDGLDDADPTELDIDGDGVANSQPPLGTDPDACPFLSDCDFDGIADNLDGAPQDPDVDDDGILDGADPDIDGDGIANADDANSFDPTITNDADGDGIPDSSDAYPNFAQPSFDQSIPNQLSVDVSASGALQVFGASAADGASISYSVTGSASFEIDNATGMLSIAAGSNLVGSQSPISLTITAENTPGNSVDHSLTISLVNGMLDSTVAELRSGNVPSAAQIQGALVGAGANADAISAFVGENVCGAAFDQSCASVLVGYGTDSSSLTGDQSNLLSFFERALQAYVAAVDATLVAAGQPTDSSAATCSAGVTVEGPLICDYQNILPWRCSTATSGWTNSGRDFTRGSFTGVSAGSQTLRIRVERVAWAGIAAPALHIYDYNYPVQLSVDQPSYTYTRSRGSDAHGAAVACPYWGDGNTIASEQEFLDNRGGLTSGITNALFVLPSSPIHASDWPGDESSVTYQARYWANWQANDDTTSYTVGYTNQPTGNPVGRVHSSIRSTVDFSPTTSGRTVEVDSWPTGNNVHVVCRQTVNTCQ